MAFAAEEMKAVHKWSELILQGGHADLILCRLGVFTNNGNHVALVISCQVGNNE